MVLTEVIILFIFFINSSQTNVLPYPKTFQYLAALFGEYSESLPLSWRRPLSYRNQSIDLPSKPMDWFLYYNSLRHESVKTKQILSVIRQKDKFQNGGNKKTKHAKFSAKQTFFYSWYTQVRFEICPFALLPTILAILNECRKSEHIQRQTLSKYVKDWAFCVNS